MKKIIITTALICCGLVYGVAQSTSPQVVATSGWYAAGGGFALSQTIGEMCLVQTFTQGNSILTQGFEQPEDISTSVQSITALPGNMILFPNPATDRFNLKCEFPLAGILTVSVFDIAGQKVPVSTVEEYAGGEQSITLHAAHLAAGSYFVKAELVTKNGEHYSNTVKLLITR